LEKLKHYPKDFLRHFITINETRIHHYQRQKNNQNNGKNKFLLMNVRQRKQKVLSARKSWQLFFGNAH